MDPQDAPPDRTRALRRVELLAQLADLRGLRQRVRPLRTKRDRDRAALRRSVGRL